jgi:hypothetical protein
MRHRRILPRSIALFLSSACGRAVILASIALSGALLAAPGTAATPKTTHRHRTYYRTHRVRRIRHRRNHRVAPVRAARARPQPAAPAATGPAVISTGQQVDLKRFVASETVTLFIFTNPTSTMEQSFVKTIEEHMAHRGGVRLVRLPSVSAPVAKQYAVTQTPTVIIYDRRGRESGRASELDDVASASVTAMRVARIDWVDEHDPRASEAYRMMGGGKQPVAGILKTMSLRPELMESMAQLAQRAHFSDGYLPRKTKEMVATYVSAINHCRF